MADETEVVESAAVTETPAESTPDRGALESATAERMASVFTDGSEELTEETPAEPAAEAAEKTEESQSTTEPADKTGQAAQPTPGVNPAAPKLPDAYRRSLKSYGWTDAEVDEASKSPNFLATAQKLHATRTEEIRRISDLGRRQKEQNEAAAKTQAAGPAKPTLYKKVDVAALRKQYGDEPVIASLEGLNELVDFANEVRPWMQASQERQRASEVETLGRQIDMFFSDKAMEPYHDMYGKAGATLTDQQLTHRQKVLDTADLLIGGARQMGRSMTLDEALTLAHDSVSGPVKEKAAVASLVRKVQARSAATTLRPASRNVTPPAGDRGKLVANVKKGLAAAFGT